jgi:hypothetical protein
VVNDFADDWLRLKKLLATYESAATINQWSIAMDAAEEMRHVSTRLFLFAKTEADKRG